MADLGEFRLSDSVAFSAALRRAGADAVCLEDVAAEIVGVLYHQLRHGEERNNVLVRFYKTHALADLDRHQQAVAASLAIGPLAPATRCLTLLATAGDLPEWNDRRSSRSHQAVPLADEAALAGAPMIAQLIRQLGLDASLLIDPEPDLFLELDEKTYNVFYVPDAVGDPHIPAQLDFVIPFGVRSVLGFGGMLPTGDLFATVLFSRRPIPSATAEVFRTLALSVKVAILPFVNGPIFAVPVSGDTPAPSRVPASRRAGAIEQLLEVHERTAEEHAARLELANDREQRRSAQLAALAEASALINSTLSLDTILAHVTEQARRIIGAHQAVVSMTQDQNWSQAINAISLSDRYEEFRSYVAPTDGSGIYGLVCETNRPVRLSQAELEAHPRWRGFGSEAANHPPMRGWLAAPLVSRSGANLGLVQLSDRLDGDFSAADEAILVQLAQLASASIENARSYAAEHDIAAALQRSLLPGSLPELPGVQTCARYLAGAAGIDIGGDWYDLFALSGGRIGLVVGDVAGRGVAAAAVMGQLRTSLRAYALDHIDPGAVVTRLDRLVQELNLVDFATVCYGVYDPATRCLRLASAGHPPPLVCAAGASEFVLLDVAAPLGVVAGAEVPVTEVDLGCGATVLLYSDGLVEHRGASITDGLAALAEAAGDADCGLDELAGRIVAATVGDVAADDVTLLLLRVP